MELLERQLIPRSSEQLEKELFEEIYQGMNRIAKEMSYEAVKFKSKKTRLHFHQKVERNFVKPLRDNLCQKFPDHKELICALVNLDRHCEWQYLTTHLLSQDTEEGAKRFWDLYFTISNLFFYDRSFTKQYKSGIIGQAGICRTLRKLGFPYSLATPTQDAQEKTDIWAAGERLQIKHGRKFERLKIEKVNTLFYPSAVIETENSETHYMSDAMTKISTVQESAESRGKNIGKKIDVFKISCPTGSFDLDTGEPTEEFLKQIEPEIKKYIQ